MDSAEKGLRSMPVDDRPVVYLHIGAPKSGTTYLQNILWRNRQALRADGVLYPGETYASHVHAAFDLRDAGFHGYRDPLVPGAWARMVDAARAWRGRVIISQELFSPATPEQIDRAMQMLSFADVHIIYTARDLVRQVPAAWQEDVKNRHVLGFRDFVRSLQEDADSRHPLGTAFWRMQDPVEVLARWARDIPAERVHVVTVPPAGADQDVLWDRFAKVLGIEPRRCALADAGPNLSLGAAEATLLRRLNLELDADIEWPTYDRFVKHHLAQQVLVRRPAPLKLTLPADDHEWAISQSKEIAAGLRDARYDVVGDLADLVSAPPGPAADAVDVDDVPVERQLDAAVAALAGLLRPLQGARTREREARERTQDLERQLAQRRRQPVKTLVRDASERYPLVMRARAAWWHLSERAQRWAQ